MMKSVIYDKYGGPDVLQVVEEKIPILTPSTVLVKVKAASLNPADYMIRRGHFRAVAGEKFPKHVGIDFAGVITAAGASVVGFKEGDEVFGAVVFTSPLEGTLSEYVLIDPLHIYRKPSSVSFEVAASIPVVGNTALDCVNLIGKVKAGYEVLIIGVTGGVGLVALQMAKSLGARVTGVCSTSGVEVAKAYGCDVVVDYTKEKVADLPQRFNLILELGANEPYTTYAHLMKPVAVFVNPKPSIYDVLTDFFRNLFASQQNRYIISDARDPKRLAQVLALIEEKGLKIEVAKTFRFPEQVLEAYVFMEKGRFIGKVVLTFE